MIIIRLKGGMGNQMFQYAFGRRMAEQLQCPLKLDLTALLDRSKRNFVFRDYDLHIFRIQENFVIQPSALRTIYKLRSSTVTRWMKKRVQSGRNYYKEPHFHVVESLIEDPVPNTVYEGWWQSERYFADIAEIIRREFSYSIPLLPGARAMLDRIQSSQSVCLNVRRTDFLQVDNLNTTDRDYFLRSADYLAERLSDPVFFVFSDDLEWCEQHLQLPYPVVFVPHRIKGEKFGNYHQLMQACRHYIIPNSSFAWWAVWLNDHPDKMVIAPRRWFNEPGIDTSDLVPDDWIRL